MANRFWYEKVRSLLVGRADISGSFAPNGSSALASSGVRGKGFTVARTSTGLFTITLADQYAKLVSATAGLQLATGDDKVLQFGTYVAASRTLELRVWDVSGAAVADIAADANNRIHFDLVLSVSSVD